MTARTFEAELIDHKPGLFRYAMARTRDPDRAADLVQDTCEKAIRATSRPDDGSQLCAWLCRVLRATHIDQIRHGDGETAEDLAVLETVAGRDGWDVERAAMDVSLCTVFDRMTLEHREVLVLVDVINLTYAEAAVALDVPYGTVTRRVASARQAMLAALRDDGIALTEGRVPS